MDKRSHSTATNLHGRLLCGSTEASKRSVWKLKGAWLIPGEQTGGGLDLNSHTRTGGAMSCRAVCGFESEPK